MTKNNTKMTSIIAITFFVALLLVPSGMNVHATTITPTFEDDFESGDNWTDTTTQIEVRSGALHFTSDRAIVPSYVDIGFTLANNFIMDFDLYITTSTQSQAQGEVFYFGLTDNTLTTQAAATAADQFSFNLNINSSQECQGMGVHDNEGLIASCGTKQFTTAFTTGSTKYIRMSAVGDDFTTCIYPTAARTTSTECENETQTGIAGTLSRLRAIPYDIGSDTSNHIAGVIDNIKIYDGTTSIDITVSDAPTGLNATSGNTQVSLTWTTPVNDGNDPITDYIIEYGNGTVWTTFVDGTSTITNGIVTGLTNGQQYSFRTSAVNSEGSSNPSNVVIETPNVTIQDLQNQILAMNATINHQQEDIDYLYEIWEDIRDTIITWLTGRP